MNLCLFLLKRKDGGGANAYDTLRVRASSIQRGEATPYWDNGIFCICLNKEPSRDDLLKRLLWV